MIVSFFLLPKTIFAVVTCSLFKGDRRQAIIVTLANHCLTQTVVYVWGIVFDFYLCVHLFVYKSSDFVTIRLQIVVVSPRTSTHLVKNNESQSRTSDS